MNLQSLSQSESSNFSRCLIKIGKSIFISFASCLQQEFIVEADSMMLNNSRKITNSVNAFEYNFAK